MPTNWFDRNRRQFVVEPCAVEVDRMLEPVSEETAIIRHPGESHIGLVLVLDCSGSVAYHIQDINAAIRDMIAAINADPVARRGVDLEIIAVGDGVDVVQAFETIDAVSAPTLCAGGLTPLNEGILKAARDVHNYNHRLADQGVPYRKPWVVIVSDGVATDPEREEETRRELRDAMDRGSHGHLAVWFVGVGDFDQGYVKRLGVERTLGLLDNDYRSLTSWLAENMRIQSRTQTDIEADIPPLPGSMYVPAFWRT